MYIINNLMLNLRDAYVDNALKDGFEACIMEDNLFVEFGAFLYHAARNRGASFKCLF